MDIGEVAQHSGTPPSALRYYERQGLIKSTGRKGLRRQYDDAVLERLALIALGRSAGLSLDEIGGMLVGDGRPRVDRQLLSRRADTIDTKIRKLSRIREGLRHAAECRATDHMECPTFRRLLGQAVAGKKR